MSTCNACQAEIKFARTQSNRNVMLDAAPNPEGPFIIVDRDRRRKPIVRKLRAGEAWPGVRFTTHDLTCPARSKEGDSHVRVE